MDRSIIFSNSAHIRDKYLVACSYPMPELGKEEVIFPRNIEPGRDVGDHFDQLMDLKKRIWGATSQSSGALGPFFFNPAVK